MVLLHAFMQSRSATLHSRTHVMLAALQVDRQSTFGLAVGSDVGMEVGSAVGKEVGSPVAVLDALGPADAVPLGTAVAVAVTLAPGIAAGGAAALAEPEAEASPEAAAVAVAGGGASFSESHLPDHVSQSPVPTSTMLPDESRVNVPSQPFSVAKRHEKSLKHFIVLNRADPEAPTFTEPPLALLPRGTEVVPPPVTVIPVGVMSRRRRWFPSGYVTSRA